MEPLMDINVPHATRDIRPSRRDVVMSQDLRPTSCLRTPMQKKFLIRGYLLAIITIFAQSMKKPTLTI